MKNTTAFPDQSAISNPNADRPRYGMKSAYCAKKTTDYRPMKSEIARLRSSLADLFFAASEKVIDAPFPLSPTMRISWCQCESWVAVNEQSV